LQQIENLSMPKVKPESVAAILGINVEKMVEHCLFPIINIAANENIPVEKAVLKHLSAKPEKMLKNEIAFLITLGMDYLFEKMTAVEDKPMGYGKCTDCTWFGVTEGCNTERGSFQCEENRGSKEEESNV